MASKPNSWFRALFTATPLALLSMIALWRDARLSAQRCVLVYLCSDLAFQSSIPFSSLSILSHSFISCIWSNNSQAGPLRWRGTTPPAPIPETAGAIYAAAPGGTASAVTGPRDSAFRQLGATALAEDMASFAFKSGDDSERAAFMEKARRGMVSGFPSGQTFCGSTVSAMDV